MSRHSIQERGPEGPFDEMPSSVRASAASVRYMDGSSLQRPLTMPAKFWPAVAAIALVALVIGYQCAHRFNYNVVNHDDRVQESVMAQVNRGVSQDVPVLSELRGMDDGAILQSFADAGYTCVDMNEINGVGEASVDIIKLPSDMSVDEASIAYAEGASKLDSTTAAKFLSASWRFMVVRESGYSYSVKYADFASTDSASAVQAAMAAQGLAESNVGESGVDDSGNSFQEGTIDIDGATYRWSISVCDLSDVYDISGMPDTAQYVGIRFTT
jgi:hypothetical protein